jgi:hypothetical protein
MFVDLVVTACLEPLTAGNLETLRQLLSTIGPEFQAHHSRHFVSLVIRNRLNVIDEPGYGDLGSAETWATIFSKSIAKLV